MKHHRHLTIALGLLASHAIAYESLQGPTELLHWDKKKAFNGYTLFAAHGTSYLIDMQGRFVHSWRLGTNPRLLDNGHLLDATKDDPSSFKGFREVDWDGNTVWEYEENRPDYAPHHDFVRTFNKKLNAWTTMFIAGKTITREMALAAGCDPSKAPSEGGEGKGRGGRLAKDGRTMVDAVVEVDGDGNVVWEWCFFDHLVQGLDPDKPNYVKSIDEAPGRLDMHLPGKPMRGDWLHCNSMDYNPELDQVVINSVQGEFYVIDHGATFVPGDPEKSVALAAGPKGDFLYRFGDPARYGQGDPPRILENWTKATSGHKQIGGAHDIQWIDAGLPGAGRFLVFNNGQYLFEPTSQSYIYEIDGFVGADGKATGRYVNPPEVGYYQVSYHPDAHKERRLLSKQITWLYGSKSNQGFFSHIGAGCQRLPNGNTLVCSDTEGHFFEVTPEGELAWEYINPITKEFGVLKILPDALPMTASVFRCYRYGPDHAAFAGRDLTPGGVLSEEVKRPARRDPSEVRFPQASNGSEARPGGGELKNPATRAPRGQADRRPRPVDQDAGGGGREGGGGGDRFARTDTNKDGKVSYEEICANEKTKNNGQLDEEKAKRKFEEIDADGDGTITPEEMAKAPRGRGGQQQR